MTTLKNCKPRTRASWSRRCVRAWLRSGGKIVRLLIVSDYRPCEHGGEPREYIKRITHRRWPTGIHLARGEYSPSYAAWYAALPADQWCEIVAIPLRSAA